MGDGRTLWLPIPSCLYVVLSEIEGITAPVSLSGSDPTWTARVPKPSRCGFFTPFEVAWAELSP